MPSVAPTVSEINPGDDASRLIPWGKQPVFNKPVFMRNFSFLLAYSPLKSNTVSTPSYLKISKAFIEGKSPIETLCIQNSKIMPRSKLIIIIIMRTSPDFIWIQNSDKNFVYQIIILLKVL